MATNRPPDSGRGAVARVDPLAAGCRSRRGSSPEMVLAPTVDHPRRETPRFLLEEEVCMNAQIECPTSKRYLTDDEIVEVVLCDEPRSFHLRIWRGKACPAIVLVSQLAGGPSPSGSSSQVANLIHRAYLGFLAEGMLYFEDQTVLGKRRLFFVGFKVFGHGLRRCLTSPYRCNFDWSDLEDTVGGKVPRGPLTAPSSFIDHAGGDVSMRRVDHRGPGDCLVPKPGGCPPKFRTGLWGARISLIGGIIAYLAVAAVMIRRRPDLTFIAAIFLFFAAHSAAHLLIQEIRRHQDEPPPEEGTGGNRCSHFDYI
jgi:hypothetical protein